jgi:hypothetical protein
MRDMKTPTIAMIIVLLTGTIAAPGCSSSSTPTVTQSITGVAERPDLLWMSLLGAIQDMGGRVTTQNRAAGTLVGMMDVEGRTVQLDVYLRTPSRMGSDLTDVDAQASLVGEDEPGAMWNDTLRRILDEYIGFVRQRVGVPR